MSSAIFDELAEQNRAQAVPLDVGSNDDRELCGHVVRIRYGPCHAQGFAASGTDPARGHEGHLAVVVDLREAREL